MKLVVSQNHRDDVDVSHLGWIPMDFISFFSSLPLFDILATLKESVQHAHGASERSALSRATLARTHPFPAFPLNSKLIYA